MPTTLSPKLLSWASVLEDKARDQALATSRLPFLAGHVALMPDAHWGMGSTVGSVIPTHGAIVPAAIGVDIGCGMIAAQLKTIEDGGKLTSNALPDDLRGLHRAIADAVPAGVGQSHADGRAIPEIENYTVAWGRNGVQALTATARNQMGTLGAGNHFVEVCLDENDEVWIVLHSGSRGVGNKLATTHIESAKGLMKAWFIELEDPDLAYLVEGTPEFDEYISDMLWAQTYAMANRDAMLMAVLFAFERECGRGVNQEFGFAGTVNCHHNFTEREQHFGKPMWITRKGAVRARTGDRGVIPGSMGTSSYIVRGLGNPASYQSCAHGAGRRMGRKAARKVLTTGALEAMMAGKAWNNDAEALLDEAPAAYKDIGQVMADQADLVTIEHTLNQVLNYKGVDRAHR